MHTASVGRRDLATNLPVERDTIFRIASMTKPLTTVAALMLYDEGRFALDEPIAGHAPELAHLRVLRDPNGPLDQTDAAERPITFGDLLTHRSGLTYGEFIAVRSRAPAPKHSEARWTTPSAPMSGSHDSPRCL